MPWGTMKTINCLRCRQCRLEPDTNFGQPLPMIHCEKTGVRRPACLTSCPIAVAATRYSGGSKKLVNGDGDMTFRSSAVEIAFLRVHYPTAPASWLKRVTGRTMVELTHRARRYGFTGRHCTDEGNANRRAAAQAGREARGQVMNVAQRECIARHRDAGDWPPTDRWHQPQWASLRAKIVAEVAALGQPFTWKQIATRAIQSSPGAKLRYARWHEKYKVRRKELRR